MNALSDKAVPIIEGTSAGGGASGVENEEVSMRRDQGTVSDILV